MDPETESDPDDHDDPVVVGGHGQQIQAARRSPMPVSHHEHRPARRFRCEIQASQSKSSGAPQNHSSVSQISEASGQRSDGPVALNDEVSHMLSLQSFHFTNPTFRSK